MKIIDLFSVGLFVGRNIGRGQWMNEELAGRVLGKSTIQKLWIFN